MPRRPLDSSRHPAKTLQDSNEHLPIKQYHLPTWVGIFLLAMSRCMIQTVDIYSFFQRLRRLKMYISNRFYFCICSSSTGRRRGGSSAKPTEACATSRKSCPHVYKSNSSPVYSHSGRPFYPLLFAEVLPSIAPCSILRANNSTYACIWCQTSNLNKSPTF